MKLVVVADESVNVSGNDMLKDDPSQVSSQSLPVIDVDAQTSCNGQVISN